MTVLPRFHPAPPPPAGTAALRRLAVRPVLARLSAIREGRLTLVEGERRHVLGDPGSDLGATVHVLDPRFWSAVAFRGSVGAGEAYVAGWWTADDLVAAVRVLARNRDVLEGVNRGLARLSAPALRAFHAVRDNTRVGSRRNIAAHYDLGNEFFACFLDETMTYSSAIYPSPTSSLREAQGAKMDRICRTLGLTPSDHLLEIGTGWGALAVHAATRYGCRVTTTTISREQHAAAEERVRAAGVGTRVRVLLEDYRDLTGTYDKAVSVEMVEAVGHAHYDAYFGTIARRLASDGVALLQAIVIEGGAYDRARRGVDFIRRHVFPGTNIPSLAEITASLARATDLSLVRLEDLTPHYVRTLLDWRENLRRNADRARALGATDETLRLWEYYFCYCAGGFAERRIGDVQMLLARPRWAGSGLPALRG